MTVETNYGCWSNWVIQKPMLRIILRWDYPEPSHRLSLPSPDCHDCCPGSTSYWVWQHVHHYRPHEVKNCVFTVHGLLLLSRLATPDRGWHSCLAVGGATSHRMWMTLRYSWQILCQIFNLLSWGNQGASLILTLLQVMGLLFQSNPLTELCLLKIVCVTRRYLDHL